MKTKHWMMVGTWMAMLGLTACNDFSSAGGVLATAFSALNEGNVGLFTSTLTGDALDRFGGEAGFRSIQKEIAGLAMEASQPRMISESVCGPHCFRKTYQFDVMGRKDSGSEVVYKKSTEVVCDQVESFNLIKTHNVITQCSISKIGLN